MELGELKVFVTVAAEHSFSRAAIMLAFMIESAVLALVADAVVESYDAGIDVIVAITENIPSMDMARTVPYLRGGAREVTLIGPNCPGLISPGKANVGIIPGEICSPGPVGLVSRSGTLTYQIGSELKQAMRGYGRLACALTLVHDAARPLVTDAVIERAGELSARYTRSDGVISVGVGGAAEVADALPGLSQKISHERDPVTAGAALHPVAEKEGRERHVADGPGVGAATVAEPSSLRNST